MTYLLEVSSQMMKWKSDQYKKIILRIRIMLIKFYKNNRNKIMLYKLWETAFMVQKQNSLIKPNKNSSQMKRMGNHNHNLINKW